MIEFVTKCMEDFMLDKMLELDFDDPNECDKVQSRLWKKHEIGTIRYGFSSLLILAGDMWAYYALKTNYLLKLREIKIVED